MPQSSRFALIVEDEQDTSDILASLVRAHGLEPVQIYRGSEVEEAVRQYDPAVILLDLMLPEVDGFTLCERLKCRRETNLIPVLIITALGDMNHQVRGIRVGANAYVPKPFTLPQISAAIEDALNWRQQHEATGIGGEVHFHVRSEMPHLQAINDMLTDLYAWTPLTERQIKDLKQAVMEMGGNAIEWGHKRNADLVLQITYRIDPDRVTLVIRDQGPGFDPHKLPHAASEDDPVAHLNVRSELGIREGGFGIMLARGLVDEFRYNETGNEVTLIKRFEPAEARTES